MFFPRSVFAYDDKVVLTFTPDRELYSREMENRYICLLTK